MDYDQAKLYGLRFELLRNIAYHDRRRRWFLRWDRILQATSVFMSCGAIAFFFANLGDYAPAIPAVLAAAATSLNLVFDCRGRAYEYHSLAKRYYAIVEKLEDALHRGVLCEATMCDLFQEMNAIHKDEPPLSVTLNLMAHNEALYQLSGDNLSHVKEHKEHLRWYERLLANWLDLKSAV